MKTRRTKRPEPKQPTTIDAIYDLQKQLWSKLVETDSKAQAVVIRLSNLQTEIQNLAQANRQTVSLILRLLDDPEALRHAQAVAKEFGTGGAAMNKPTPH